MKYLIIVFLFLSFNSFSQLDSIQVTKIVRLINDYKACVEYSEEIEERLIVARDLLSRKVAESNEYKRLFDEVNSALEVMNERNMKLEKKLKRTRRIGIGATIFGFLVGILLPLIL